MDDSVLQLLGEPYRTHPEELSLRHYRVIDPEAKGPITAIEVTGPPTSHLAKQIAARALQGCSPDPPDEGIHQAITERLVAKPIGDRFHRWAINRLHACYEEAEGWEFDGSEIQIEQYSADGLIVAFHPIDCNTGNASIYPYRRILVIARII